MQTVSPPEPTAGRENAAETTAPRGWVPVWLRKHGRKGSRVAQRFYYSLPLQLLVNQLASHRVLLATWGLLFLLVTGSLGNSFGVPQLFLEPEYGQQVNFTSCFVMGLALGIFTLAFQMTSYIFDGYRYYFIALLRHPFRVFAVNNSIVPLLFWGTYLYCFYQFQTREPGPLPPSQVYPLLAALLSGGLVINVISLIYFSLTNRSALRALGDRFVRGLQNPMRMARRTRVAMESAVRVDSYVTANLAIRPVVQIIRGDSRPILQVLNQNHTNAIAVILLLSLILLTQGWWQESMGAQLPAGASVLLVLAFVVMLGGAITFWFRKVGPLVIVGVVAFFYLVNTISPGRVLHPAYGLNYDGAHAVYHTDSLRSLANEARAQADMAEGRQQLEKWLARYRSLYGANAKPKLVLVCVTGGGLRSATWTMRGLQAADSVTGGRLADHLRLMTGASGGMISAAYYRELLLLERTGTYPADLPPRGSAEHPYRVSRDLLNSVMGNYLANALLPLPSVELDSHTYTRDRGYNFERQLEANTGVFAGRRLGHYRVAEAEAQVPMIIFSPAILHDGRQLLVSPQPLGYMTRGVRFNYLYANETPAVELQRLFAAQHADSLLMTTAIRMNASFPYILPFTELPTTPRTEVMDAGVYDNFGLTLAVRYLYTFRDWISENTGGVVILQIRDSQREAPIQHDAQATSLTRLAGVLGGTYNTLAESRDFQNDDLLAYAKTWFQAPLDVLELQYIPARAFEEASLNLHLTRREREDVLASIHNQQNRQTLALLRQLLLEDR